MMVVGSQENCCMVERGVLYTHLYFMASHENYTVGSWVDQLSCVGQQGK
jgi:hypothetical protein